MFDTIVSIPFNFLANYTTGWTLIGFIILIIYFVALRKYYLNKEEFYNSNITDINDITENRTKKNKSNKKNDKNNSKQNKNQDTIIESFESFESFESNIPNKTTPGQSIPSNPKYPASINQHLPNIIINTTLFDNLQLLPEQVIKCKTFYRSIIINYIVEFTKLLKLIKNNKFLNVEKQFNNILTKGIDSIISFLSNTIKSMTILTRNSIKTDLLNILSNTIDSFINKENINLTNEINDLARLNSTTIDYMTMTSKIDESRNKIEEYIEIDKLISTYGQTNTYSQSKVNKVLDKSFILPIYEKNFDRINQLVHSDFNDNYTKLADKYGAAYTDYLNKKKKEELNINPLEMLSKIESGVVNFLTDITSSGGNNKKEKTYNHSNDVVEQYTAEYGHFNNTINQVRSNPLPKQNSNLVKDTILNENNIYKDSGNLGNYLINDNTHKDILEGFDVNTTTPNTTNPNTTVPDTTVPESTKPNTTKPNTTKPNTTKPNTTIPKVLYTKPKISTTKKNIKNENTNMVSKLFSGEFLNYIMEMTNDKLSMFYKAYYKQFNTYDTENNYDSNENKFNVDDNLIPAGFLLFLVSMFIYFIDLTS